jgi:beta-lactamase class D
MKKLILVIIVFIANLAQADCFLAQEKDKILIQEGECKTAYAPACSFNFALSLMGFDSGILLDEYNPKWSNDDPNIFPNACKGNQSPSSWIKNSCVWYSKELTSKLGMQKFQKYVTNFNYGNMDLSGGLTEAWISSSLKISPIEQIEFLQKIVRQKLPVSKKSYENTKKIMFVQEMSSGWKLYGKTGLSTLRDKNGNLTDLHNGWFIGYIEKNGRTIEFASHIVDTKKQNSFASFRAKNEALTKLWYLIDNLEK